MTALSRTSDSYSSYDLHVLKRRQRLASAGQGPRAHRAPMQARLASRSTGCEVQQLCRLARRRLRRQGNGRANRNPGITNRMSSDGGQSRRATYQPVAPHRSDRGKVGRVRLLLQHVLFPKRRRFVSSAQACNGAAEESYPNFRHALPLAILVQKACGAEVVEAAAGARAKRLPHGFEDASHGRVDPQICRQPSQSGLLREQRVADRSTAGRLTDYE